jgi:hypothetical protein
MTEAQPWLWKQQATLKRRWSTRLYGATIPERSYLHQPRDLTIVSSFLWSCIKRQHELQAPLIPLPLTSNGHRTHRFAPATHLPYQQLAAAAARPSPSCRCRMAIRHTVWLNFTRKELLIDFLFGSHVPESKHRLIFRISTHMNHLKNDSTENPHNPYHSSYIRYKTDRQ